LTSAGFGAAAFFCGCKGVAIGFASSFIASRFGSNGILFGLLTIAPHNLIMIPALLFGCVAMMNRTIKAKPGDLRRVQGRHSALNAAYALNMLFAFACSLLGVFVESYAVPSLIFMISPRML
jgi:stage II sporulation protein M